MKTLLMAILGAALLSTAVVAAVGLYVKNPTPGDVADASRQSPTALVLYGDPQF
jgi:hypothetical protein